MTLLSFEIGKIANRRLSLILLIATILLFPIIVKVITHLSAAQNKVPEGLFANFVAQTVIDLTQSFLFIPVWMILLVGLEFSSGHVNRVAFTRSRGYYFTSKLTFTVIVTLFFSVLGMITFMIAAETSPFKYLDVSLVFYLQFFVQLLVAALAYSILLLCVVYWLRSPLIAFIVYYIWNFAEALTYMVLKGFYLIELNWLPIHLLKTLYLRSQGDSTSKADYDNYYNPLVESPSSVIVPIGMVVAILFLTYRMFIRKDLKPLSD